MKNKTESKKINDLRSALEVIQALPRQYHETAVEIDPKDDLAGVYRYIGAGGTVVRPTQVGPALMFTNIKGYPGTRVLVGLIASRERVAAMLGAPVRELGKYMAQAVKNTVDPVFADQSKALCQEVVYKATDKGFDLRKILPAPTNTPQDAGPYFCEGLVLGSDPENGHTDVTIHRLCV